jgi:hypothetical protein
MATSNFVPKIVVRGGVVGGGSAGATIQGSYLVRGARAGNSIMMFPGHETGFGLLPHSAIDQHVDTHHRESDLDQVISSVGSANLHGTGGSASNWQEAGWFTLLNLAAPRDTGGTDQFTAGLNPAAGNFKVLVWRDLLNCHESRNGRHDGAVAGRVLMVALIGHGLH